MEYSRDEPQRLQKPKDVKMMWIHTWYLLHAFLSWGCESSENGSFQQSVAKYTGHDRTSTYICIFLCIVMYPACTWVNYNTSISPRCHNPSTKRHFKLSFWALYAIKSPDAGWCWGPWHGQQPNLVALCSRVRRSICFPQHHLELGSLAINKPAWKV